ncbi:MAG: LysR family transcriptional regulator [Leptolyngbyaceae cyanobacterium MO_188.B28]|nr:LysR family transcriptional regulator [Leptolyngbyaceae cyanobacterium MO_188.B28]
MDLYQICYFLTIADLGSFTKAAEQLYVSQPSLSAGIKKLEQELDTLLFERGGRRILLTPAGRLFQERAQAILGEYQSIRHDLKKLKDQPKLRLATLPSIRGGSMAEIIGAFRLQHPQVTIEICTGYLQDLQHWLAQGDVDLALTWLQEQDNSQTSQFLLDLSGI